MKFQIIDNTTDEIMGHGETLEEALAQAATELGTDTASEFLMCTPAQVVMNLIENDDYRLETA